MRPSLELWGGIECTINRVGERVIDQLARCGHYARLEADLDRIAALGIRTLRYPALWERMAPHGPGRLDEIDWSGCDAALRAMRERQIEPIIGLLHHGSGPSSTNLLHPGFAEGFAEYAGAFARRYPSVRCYTPINEPLTTARFSALYGHWYPHAHDDRSFVTALVTQCRAIVLAMDAIRQVNPLAELIQTEDAAFTRSTPALAKQAEFDNARRWISLDLLTGRVTSGHPLWSYLRTSATTSRDVEWFQDHQAVLGTIGLNYYVTSDRFLDDRLHLHPPESHGGNGRLRYADVEAARAEGIGIRGHYAVLEEAWTRYRLPLAISEVHLGCSREDQLRWLDEAWRGATAAQRDGAEVRAVTVWALLGSWDWDCLVTRTRGHYEAGAFDVRGEAPRSTALARMVRGLTEDGSYTHPVLTRPGWWRPDNSSSMPTADRFRPTSPVLIFGASGTLGGGFVRVCRSRRIPFEAIVRHDVDVTDPVAVRGAIARFRPWAIINATGYVRVDEAQADARACRRVNSVGPAILAVCCRQAGIRLLTFSSDLVFDGQSSRPYLETDPVAPMNIYGHTKAEAERRVLALAPTALVIRSSAFFGPWDPGNFLTAALDTIGSGDMFRAADDTMVSPTYVPDLVHVALDLLMDDASGLWHLANDGAMTWAEFAERAAREAGLDSELIERCPLTSLQLPAPRPKYSALASVHGRLLPHVHDSLARYVHHRRSLGTAA
jgi:dTDP-4-dehydrorhamnose reductase